MINRTWINCNTKVLLHSYWSFPLASYKLNFHLFNDTFLCSRQVQYVKDLTILPSIEDSDWKEDCCTIIREYFENPACTLLCIYFQVDTLKAQLSISDANQSDFVYFSRIPSHVFTVDNFHATVTFGSINRNAMVCVLKVMENMYVPIARDTGEWPDIIRNDLFFNLHNFLMCLTEWVYKPMGLTKLYVPAENLSDVATSPRSRQPNFTETSGPHISEKLRESEKALIDRFERIARYWVKQIRQVLASRSTSKGERTIFDELQRWTARYFNLCCLHDQLSSTEIRSILHLLKNVCSPSVDSFQLLTLQLREELEQAASNITYLNVLSEACNNLKCPGEIEEPVMKILFLILFIWTESSFYNLSSNTEVLCEAISTQIVHQCKDCINLQVILEGDAENGIDILRKCISCCETYKTTYTKITKITALIRSNTTWDVNKHLIFNYIDTFMQRCRDIIEICDSSIVFGRCNKVGIIGGPRGIEYDAYCRQIESLFYESLDEIKLIRDDILNVTKSSWLESMLKFRNFVVELEGMVKTLIDRVFEEIKTVEEGVEAVYALQRFKHRESLRDILSKKWVQVWKVFGKEIESCSNIMTFHETYYTPFQCYSEDVIILCIKQYLERLFHMMMDMSDWMGDCSAENYILEQYKRVMTCRS
ncbi:PREDICTED: dynein-1-beta heavy chain, flagellar inner arm I1 complex isoform X2 [Vollenhovia emeryi]|uniref:dynein-1-beta heavy chain, flagellar inner arm I1 complex isoform X2 n=1 Tax=Vollenhovia emeryi TaxID=411798 RepID=UPI0005F44EB7|nr:PREDICTED: dynein-1-beta heavy chain, flagellar inner arm I1 complex isoform X2 [Vollenhovia emeryi]XP_011874785.1 PREDICTED: dynein-1-beta heavy chain, flagellar inner arm I1 complex isoform X2 [Vollenhovia emeryi]